MREIATAVGLVALTAATLLTALYACPLTTQLLFGQPRVVFAQPSDLCVPVSPG